jgi:hypothetical protein
MRFFPLLDFQHVVLALFLGLLGVILAAAAWGGYARRGNAPPETDGGDANPRAEENPIPPVLVFVYAAVAACAFGYAGFIWSNGLPVGY